MSDFSNRLKKLRIANVKSQQELATALDVSQNAIYNWENGKREPSLEMIKKIAEYFKVSFDYLMGFEDKKTLKTHELFSGISFSEPSIAKEKKILYVFNKLSEEGKDKAIEQVEMLAKIPEYQSLEETAEYVLEQKLSLPSIEADRENYDGKKVILTPADSPEE